MSEEMLHDIEIALLSALLKSAAVARDLTKAGFRPDLMPSPTGRDLARLVLRVRDAREDVTDDVEAQIPGMYSLGAEGARLLALARGVVCPGRAQALAYLALLELSETSRRLETTRAKVQELLGPPPVPGDAWPPAGSSPVASGRTLRRVRLPEPGAPHPGKRPGPRRPDRD